MNQFLSNSTLENFHPLIEQAVQIISTENLDLACTLIEKAATEKAVRYQSHIHNMYALTCYTGILMKH